MVYGLWIWKKISSDNRNTEQISQIFKWLIHGKTCSKWLKLEKTGILVFTGIKIAFLENRNICFEFHKRTYIVNFITYSAVPAIGRITARDHLSIYSHSKLFCERQESLLAQY